MQPQTPTESSLSNPQQQVIDRLRSGVNVLVTVSNDPTVDQLAAAIGFTLMLNKLGKHATAVFSGKVPSTLEFLKPEATIEKTTDSLRDFIISLDKSKADKLRYKVEENVVKIFITPYRTSLSEKDLEFGQGDFNVDIVVALGVTEQRQLDQAITSHGRILHDATVITVSVGDKSSSLGAINWHDPSAASLCEMLVAVGDALQPNLLDPQDATALLTGIVAQTDRFSNDKTTPRIMSMAAQLMAAGANQQLIASELEHDEPAKEVVPEAVAKAEASEKPTDSLVIEHEAPETTSSEEDKTEIAIDEHGNLSLGADSKTEDKTPEEVVPLPPALDDTTLREIEKGVDSKHIVHDPTSTLDEIEEAVDSPHQEVKPEGSELPRPEAASASSNFVETPHELVLPPLTPDSEAKEETVDAARDAVSDAMATMPYDANRPNPDAALNAAPIELATQPTPSVDTLAPSLDADLSAASQSATAPTVPDMFVPTDKVEAPKFNNASADINEQAPPPVPPPMVPLQ